MSDCPCGSKISFDACCGPFLAGKKYPETAEALMRSRYAAYVKKEVVYLGETLHPDYREDYDENATRSWANAASWIGLEILNVSDGPEDGEQTVEFIASYREKDKLNRHHELGRFSQLEGRWYYVEGIAPKVETIVNSDAKTGRNDPCPCGSGKKYKKCCGK